MEKNKEKLLSLLREKIRESSFTNEEQKMFRLDITTKLASLEGYAPEEIDRMFYKYFGVELNFNSIYNTLKYENDLEQAVENLYSRIYNLTQYPNLIAAKINFIEDCIGKYTKTLGKSEKVNELLNELDKETKYWKHKEISKEENYQKGEFEEDYPRSELLSRVWIKDCEDIEILVKNYINSENTQDKKIQQSVGIATGEEIESNEIDSLSNIENSKEAEVNKILILSDLGELAYVKNGDKSELAIIPKDSNFINQLAEYTNLKTGTYLFVENNKMVSGNILLTRCYKGSYTLEKKGFKAIEEFLNKAGFDLNTETLKIAIKTYIKLVLTRYGLYRYKDLAENIAKKVSGISSPSGALAELKSLIQTELGTILLELDSNENE